MGRFHIGNLGFPASGVVRNTGNVEPPVGATDRFCRRQFDEFSVSKAIDGNASTGGLKRPDRDDFEAAVPVQVDNPGGSVLENLIFRQIKPIGSTISDGNVKRSRLDGISEDCVPVSLRRRAVPGSDGVRCTWPEYGVSAVRKAVLRFRS